MTFYHQRGIIHVIVNLNIDYFNSARIGDMILIETALQKSTDKSVVFNQVISREDNKLLSANITNVYLNRCDHSIFKTEEMKDFWKDLS
jgi:YbgC/YbaW family acyl-CoA thioester hydrolase